MHKRRNRSTQDAIAYHIARNHAAIFTSTNQDGRIKRAQALVAKVVEGRSKATIIELGCGSLDISGPFSNDHRVIGIDCIAEAPLVVAERFGNAQVWVAPIEWLKPQPCDVLVLCEFLEHVGEPLEIVKQWLPLAKFAAIGHPLNEPDIGGEEGHAWSYEDADWHNWFQIGGHEVIEHEIFPMPPYLEMVIGLGRRVE